jgi:type II secretory pathway pseudopilin PulG
MTLTTIRRSVRGFTLVQLLVVLVMIGVVIALLVPAMQLVRQAAARTQSSNNLHQLGIGCITCAEQRRGNLPPAYGDWPACDSKTDDSFFYRIIPYIEANDIYSKRKLNAAIKTYSAPLDNSNDGSSNKISYAVNSSLLVPNLGAHYPDCFENKGATNQILLFERFAVTGYTIHTWSAVTTTGSPQVAAVDGATAGLCVFDIPNTEISTGPSDRTAHAFTSHGFLVCVGDASTRFLGKYGNNDFVRFSLEPGESYRGTTFTWACDPSATRQGPTDGSW